MSLLRVDPRGLQCLAAACETWSAEIAATAAPSVPAGSVQATIAAVSAIHAEAGSAGGMLSIRMRATAAALHTAAAAHLAREAESAAELVGPGR